MEELNNEVINDVVESTVEVTKSGLGKKAGILGVTAAAIAGGVYAFKKWHSSHYISLKDLGEEIDEDDVEDEVEEEPKKTK